MRKLILKTDVSLDGFIGGPNGEAEWIFETSDEGCTTWVLEGVWQAGMHVMGRKTFEVMASYWPSSTNRFAAPMNALPKLVFSRSGKVDFDAIWQAAEKLGPDDTTPDREQKKIKRASAEETKKNRQSWREATVASDLIAEITRQKSLPGNPLIAYGGAEFVRELIKHDLIDEYRFVVHPVALGKGQAIFDGLEQPLKLKLVSSTAFPGGATAQIFARER